jgi:hypothetical protein
MATPGGSGRSSCATCSARRSTGTRSVRRSRPPSSLDAVDRLVFRTFLSETPDTANARRLQARDQEHRASLFVFFDRPDVPPTNNASEQDLRPSAIHRKVTGGSRSQLGADISAVFTSLLTTPRKRGENLFQAPRSVAGPSPLRAAGMPT